MLVPRYLKINKSEAYLALYFKKVTMTFSLLVSFLFILGRTSVSADKTTDYIHKLEQKISDLESHNQASEQKQAATLASILSKLQAQEEKIQELKAVCENTTTKSSSTTSTTGSKEVAFEATTLSDQTAPLIHFQKVMFNVGGGFDAQSGMFTAPTTGIYQFWFTAYVTEGHISNTQDLLYLEVVGSSYGNSYVSPITQLREHSKQRSFVKLVQGMHVLPLAEGDTVSVKGKSIVPVETGSFGGHLIV